MKSLRASLTCPRAAALVAAALLVAAAPLLVAEEGVLAPFGMDAKAAIGDVHLTWSGAAIVTDAQLSIRSNSASAGWTTKKSLTELASIHHLRLPAGEYTIRFSAAGYKPVIVTARAAAGERTNVEIALHRFPRLTGTVMRGNAPLAGATVATDAGDLAKSDALGRFALVVEHEWRPEIRVNYPGLATRYVNVPAAQADADLGVVTLAAGGTVVIEVQLPEGVDDASADIVTAQSGTVVVTRPVSRTSSRVSFDALEPGDYRLVIRGPQPLQRMSKAIAVRAGDTTEALVIVHQRSLQLNIRNSEAKDLAGAVYLKNMDGRWIANVDVPDTGLTAPLWQSGDFSVSVKAAGRDTPYFTHATITDDDSPSLTITLPDGRIAGHVRDTAGHPLAGSELALTTATDTGVSTRLARSDDDGAYSFDFIDAGEQSLRAAADGYIPVTMNLDMPRAMQLSTFDVQLRKGRQTDVLVVDQQGTPLPDATVIATTAGEVIGYYTSGADGIAHVSAEADRSAALFVIPKSGSFAVAHNSPEQSGIVRVTVPNPTAHLELSAVDDRDEPVGPVDFLLRYDGEMFPLAALTQLALKTGVRFRTDDDGHLAVNALPPGVYELLPFSSMQMATDLIDAGSGSNTVRVSLVPGPNTVTAKFKH